MVQLDNFPEHLRSISLQQWEKLFNLIPETEATETFGWVVESKLQPNGSYTFPYWDEAEIVTRVGTVLYDELNLLPIFDWVSWEEGGTILYSNTDFKTLDIITLCKVLTAIYRMARFSEGHVVSIFQQGIMLRILKALQYHVKQGNLPEK